MYGVQKYDYDIRKYQVIANGSSSVSFRCLEVVRRSMVLGRFFFLLLEM